MLLWWNFPLDIWKKLSVCVTWQSNLARILVWLLSYLSWTVLRLITEVRVVRLEFLNSLGVCNLQLLPCVSTHDGADERVQITLVSRLRGVSHDPVLRIQQGCSCLKQDSRTCCSLWQLFDRKEVDSEVWNTKCSREWYNPETSFWQLVACYQSAPSYILCSLFPHCMHSGAISV